MKGSYKYFLIALIGTLFITCDEPGEHYSELMNVPISENSGQSDLSVSKNGDLFLSWIESDSLGKSKLLISKFDGNTWKEPIKIAEGNDWFVNWADFPSIEHWDNEKMVAHFLRKSGPDTYAYDVMLSVSQDYGKTWSKPFVPHRDGTLTEHGFVSKTGITDSTYMAVWLDGRQFAYAKKDSTLTSQMSLRSAIFNDIESIVAEHVVDNRVCDCCQTSMTMTETGPLIVYRDRSEEEIRDIYYSKFADDRWTPPQPIYDDNWIINGCPVNGPTVQSNGQNVAVAWFAMNGEIPEVKLSFSNNSGETFEIPYLLDFNYPAGRVDLKWINGTEVIVSWMDQEDSGNAIVLQRVSVDGRKSELHTLAEISPERSTGFPRMAIYDDHILVTWTEVDAFSRVRMGKLPIDEID